MITSAIPVIAVSDSVAAEDYYCRVLGFQKMFAYRPDPSKSDPCYLGVARDGVWLHLQSFKRERAGMTDAFLWVADVDLRMPRCRRAARWSSYRQPIRRGGLARQVFVIP